MFNTSSAVNAYQVVNDYTSGLNTLRFINGTKMPAMTDFYALDAAGQVAALDQLAREALIHYGLNFAAPTLVNYSNNAVYHVHAGTYQYALRIHRPGLKRLAWVKSELAWLTALRTDTGLAVPQPAAPIYFGTLPGVNEPVYCVLFRWLDGELLTKNPVTEAQMVKIGAFAAQLHDYSAIFNTPDGFERPRLDYEGMFGVNSPYYPGEAGEALFTDAHKAVMGAAQVQVKAVMAALGDDPQHFGLIHADLIRKNLLWQPHGEIAALDFDDCAYGYYLYELAPLLMFLKDEPNAADLRKALWAGYTSIRPLPAHYEAYLDTLIAARHIASIRWIAGNQYNPAVYGRAAEIIDTRANALKHFLDTGHL